MPTGLSLGGSAAAAVAAAAAEIGRAEQLVHRVRPRPSVRPPATPTSAAALTKNWRTFWSVVVWLVVRVHRAELEISASFPESRMKRIGVCKFVGSSVWDKWSGDDKRLTNISWIMYLRIERTVNQISDTVQLLN